MKLIRNVDNDLINLDQASFIYLNDLGDEERIRFQIVAVIDGREYLIKEYRSEKCANGFLTRLWEKCKVEVKD